MLEAVQTSHTGQPAPQQQLQAGTHLTELGLQQEIVEARGVDAHIALLHLLAALGLQAIAAQNARSRSSCALLLRCTITQSELQTHVCDCFCLLLFVVYQLLLGLGAVCGVRHAGWRREPAVCQSTSRLLPL